MNMQATFPVAHTKQQRTLKLCLIAFFSLWLLTVLHFIGLQNEQTWVSSVKSLQLLAFVSFHILLGLSAKQSGRSLLLYGLVPVVLPILGGSAALFVLWRKLRAPNA